MKMLEHIDHLKNEYRETVKRSLTDDTTPKTETHLIIDENQNGYVLELYWDVSNPADPGAAYLLTPIQNGENQQDCVDSGSL